MATQSSPIQATGHADMVQATDGSWWLVCLGIRPQTGMNHLLGRETFLAPAATKAQKQIFSSEHLGPEWVYVRNPLTENYENCSDGLVLHGTGATLDATEESPTMVLRRQRNINCEEVQGGFTYSVRDSTRLLQSDFIP